MLEAPEPISNMYGLDLKWVTRWDIVTIFTVFSIPDVLRAFHWNWIKGRYWLWSAILQKRIGYTNMNLPRQKLVKYRFNAKVVDHLLHFNKKITSKVYLVENLISLLGS